MRALGNILLWGTLIVFFLWDEDLLPEFESAESEATPAIVAVSAYDKARMNLAAADKGLDALSAELGTGGLENAKKLGGYAKTVAEVNPSAAEIATLLAKEATAEGAAFKGLQDRYFDALDGFETKGRTSRDAAAEIALEADNITIAAQPAVFDDSLIDPINVLADLSNGTLERVATPAQGEEGAGTHDSPGQHLVGNPSYGFWGGGGFWTWYGQYRLFSDVLDLATGGWRRDAWYRGRGASYYGDVGRHYYGSSRSNSDWSRARQKFPDVAANKAPQKTYGSLKSSRRLSTYAPTTNSAPRGFAKASAASTGGISQPRRSAYSYVNTRSSPSRSGGFGGRTGGK